MMQQKAAALSRWIETASVWAACFCLAVNIAVVLFGIVMRYGFAASPIWVHELARYALIWAVMLAGAAAFRRGEHMQIDIVLNLLPPRLAWGVNFVRRVAIFLVLLFMTGFGIYYTLGVVDMTTLALNVSRAVPLASIPAGMALMLLQFLVLQLAGPAETVSDESKATI